MGILDGKVAIVTGASRGIGAQIARRFGHALSPSKVVPTPGTIFHHLTTADNPDAEPPEVMAAAALVLCSGEPKALTGRITYSQDLLAERRQGDGTAPARR